jgi:hypothetical protein
MVFSMDQLDQSGLCGRIIRVMGSAGPGTRMTVLVRASSNFPDRQTRQKSQSTGVSADKLVLTYSATNVAPTQKDQPLLLSKRRPHFKTHKWSWKEKNVFTDPEGA